MKTYEKIFDDMQNTSSDMATIIGRYRGAMKVFAEDLNHLAKIIRTPEKELKAKSIAARLEFIENLMLETIAENNKLWEKMGKKG